MCDGPGLYQLLILTQGSELLTYSSFPRIGASPLICVPSAARTCCDESDTKSSMLPIISLSRVSRSSNLQNPVEGQQGDPSNPISLLSQTWDLSSYSSADFGFGVFQELDKCRN